MGVSLSRVPLLAPQLRTAATQATSCRGGTTTRDALQMLGGMEDPHVVSVCRWFNIWCALFGVL